MKNTITKILVVDDDELSRLQISLLLEENFDKKNIFCNDTIEGAWETLTKETIDIVLLDIYLPGKNGADLITDMLNNDQLKDIPIIVITGTREDSFVKLFFEKHVRAYLHKPIDKNELSKALEKILPKTILG